LFVFMSMYYLLPILPLFITEVFAGDKGQVGYVFGIFAFAGVITRPVAGYLLDVIGRKPIAWISITCLFLAMLSYNWITSLLLLLILRCIHGVCWGVSTTSLATLVIDSIPLKQRGEGIGYYGLSISVAMFIGPILGLDILRDFGYSISFSLGAGLAAIALLCLFGLKRQEVCPVPNEKHKGILEKRVFSYALIVFFLSLLYSGILSFIVLFAKEISIENSEVYFLVNALTLLVSRPYAGRILDKSGPVKIMCIGFLALFATFICLFFAESYLLFILSALLLGIGFGIIHSAAITLAINKVDASRRGVVNGTILTAFDLGFGIGSMLLGILSNYAGLKIMYLTSGFMVLIPFSIFYITHMIKNKETEAIN
ncbi:MAG: major facilitator superfamily 1, partial [Firmicutes bacterium]|nr:major facilitator superfamily 1 [Bacillota bacterium]